MSAPLESGERALLIDRKGRRYLVTLRPGGEFHTHHGAVAHDAIIGFHEGVRVYSTSGVPLIVFRPSLAEFVLKMPRGAQVIYPKDIGLILVLADIGPGQTVLEAGTGSGALTLALSRMVGERGRLISYEIREDFHARARANVEAFLGKIPPSLELRLGDLTAGVPERDVDRIVLDLPEPWTVIPVAREVLRPGAIFCSYVPTVLQVHQAVEELRGAGFTEIATIEGLVRPWHVEGQSVRPDHRMVAHTGFITTARFLGV
ncbi:MAG: tRNA (adenine-N1)-methyltransferase [Acidobacteria bacterium]|nr:tRNA (adenine-N1)-methyltransferase [Acidobacteriota bacterium]